MDEQRFDSLTAALAEVRGRRSFFRFVAASALAAAGAGAFAAGTDARRGKGKGKGKDKGGGNGGEPPTIPPPTTPPPPPPPLTCQAGERVGIVNVAGNGDAALTPVLLAGSRYMLRASGSVRSNATQSVDAEFLYLTANPQAFTDIVGNVDVGISIDGNQPNWGGYDTDHAYAVELNGQGQALTLRMQDANLADNSGSITVEVICAGAARSSLGRRISPLRRGAGRGR